jgi:hypothetical protein
MGKSWSRYDEELLMAIDTAHRPSPLVLKTFKFKNGANQQKMYGQSWNAPTTKINFPLAPA